MANYFANLSRVRPYLVRLPLATRLILFIVVACFLVSFTWQSIHTAAILKPSLVNLQTLHKLSTFPFFHRSFFHLALNLPAFIPLLERFEAENGSLVSIILFTGPFATFPGAMYTVVERFVLRGDTAIEGTSVWVFLLLSAEAMKMYRANPYFSLGPYKIPTWTSPILFILAVSFIIPNTSLVGHVCGSVIGYGWGYGILRFLAPPEWLIRWIEGKLNLLGRVPHYVSVDQKTYGRYGVLPSTFEASERGENHTMNFFGPGHRVGPDP